MSEQRNNRQKAAPNPRPFPQRLSRRRARNPAWHRTVSRGALREPEDVQIEILYCGVCHSDLHSSRDEWNARDADRLSVRSGP